MKKFARICSYTNQPINEGFYIWGDYLADTDEAKQMFLNKNKIKGTFPQFMEREYSDDCYYTEWELDEEYYFDDYRNLMVVI